MGADYEGQERGIEDLKAMSDEARQYLCHHLRNSLTAVLCGIQVEQFDLAEEAARHMIEDLERIGC